jgi:F0F1-type ATP synthase assembly protein I
MPDDPIDKAGPTPNPEDKLRERFDNIEREESRGSQPANPDISIIPTNDEIRAGVHTSPIESQIDMSTLGSGDDHQEQEQLSEEEKQLKEFDERLKAARGGSMPEPPEWNYQRPAQGKNKVEENNYLGMGIGISIAYTLVGCTLAGWGIGKLIDMRSGGYLAQAIGTLIGAVVGLVAAIATIIRGQNKPGQ